MNKQTVLRLIAALLFAITLPVEANDSAASTALGGIQLTREPRISMAKEKLTISTEKITVEYEFLNESDHDITTEVAFPIPAYRVTMDAGGIRDFNDFGLWVEGARRAYKTEVKAMLKARDYSSLLRRYGVDIASLGHFTDDGEPFSHDFRKLPKPVQQELIKEGLFDAEIQFPLWSVEKTYHWQQSFPAHKILHVRHEYKPGIGFTPVTKDSLDTPSTDPVIEPKTGSSVYPLQDQFARESKDACVDPKLRKLLVDTIARQEYVTMAWVDYILTTAKSWKTPIKDFELVIEKPVHRDSPSYASLCWDGPIEREGANRFRARAVDFVPKAELHIAFFDSPDSTGK